MKAILRTLGLLSPMVEAMLRYLGSLKLFWRPWGWPELVTDEKLPVTAPAPYSMSHFGGPFLVIGTSLFGFVFRLVSDQVSTNCWVHFGGHFCGKDGISI